MGNSSSSGSFNSSRSDTFRTSSSYESHRGNFLDHSPVLVKSDCNNAFSTLSGYYNTSCKSDYGSGKYINSSPITVSSNCPNGFSALDTYFNPIIISTVSTDAFSNVNIGGTQISTVHLNVPQFDNCNVDQTRPETPTTSIETQKESARKRVQNKMQLINNGGNLYHYKEVKETKIITTTTITEEGKKTETQQTQESKESKEYVSACINGAKEGHENYFSLGMGTLSNPMSNTENATNDSVGQLGAALGGCVGGIIREITN